MLSSLPEVGSAQRGWLHEVCVLCGPLCHLSSTIRTSYQGPIKKPGTLHAGERKLFTHLGNHQRLELLALFLGDKVVSAVVKGAEHELERSASAVQLPVPAYWPLSDVNSSLRKETICWFLFSRESFTFRGPRIRIRKI